MVADGQQEDDREAGEQDVQRDLVRRLLALGAFDQRDHAVEEGLARVGRDADAQPVAGDRRAAGDGAADVGARLLEHRRRLAGDRRLADVGDALDDVAVAGDGLAGLDADDVALAQRGGRDLLEAAAVAGLALGHGVAAHGAQGVGLRLAATLRHRLGEVGEEDGEPEPDGDRQP